MRTHDEQLAALAADSAAIADLAAAEPDRPVPDCGDWTLGALANHLGAVQRWAAEIVRTLATERPDRDEAGPTDASAADALRAATAELTAALQAADPDAPCWAFGQPQSVGFWFRRQAQEAMVHHHDAAVAGGVPATIDPAAAVEGVTELFDTFVWRWWKRGDWAGDGETCHLHATDAEGEWLLTLVPDGPPTLELGHAKGDVAVRGRAEDLHLALWRRRPFEGFELFGADDDVARWSRRLTSLEI